MTLLLSMPARAQTRLHVVVWHEILELGVHLRVVARREGLSTHGFAFLSANNTTRVRNRTSTASFHTSSGLDTAPSPLVSIARNALRRHTVPIEATAPRTHARTHARKQAREIHTHCKYARAYFFSPAPPSMTRSCSKRSTSLRPTTSSARALVGVCVLAGVLRALVSVGRALVGVHVRSCAHTRIHTHAATHACGCASGEASCLGGGRAAALRRDRGRADSRPQRHSRAR